MEKSKGRVKGTRRRSSEGRSERKAGRGWPKMVQLSACNCRLMAEACGTCQTLFLHTWVLSLSLPQSSALSPAVWFMRLLLFSWPWQPCSTNHQVQLKTVAPFKINERTQYRAEMWCSGSLSSAITYKHTPSLFLQSPLSSLSERGQPCNPHKLIRVIALCSKTLINKKETKKRRWRRAEKKMCWCWFT